MLQSVGRALFQARRLLSGPARWYNKENTQDSMRSVLPSDKPEYPPLLPPGFHRKSLSELRQTCVDDFPASRTRDSIMQGLEAVVHSLLEAGICGDLWVDGSFLTKKIDPNDVDLLLHIKPNFYQTATAEQKQMIRWFGEDNLKDDYRCDSYVMREYPQGDPLEAENEWERSYWIKQYGWSRGLEMKGIAIILLPAGVT